MAKQLDKRLLLEEKIMKRIVLRHKQELEKIDKRKEIAELNYKTSVNQLKIIKEKEKIK